MSKPLGISLVLSDGVPVYRVDPIDRVADKIWEAVQDAQCSHWIAEQFKNEVAEAWRYEMEKQAKDDEKVLKG